MGKTHTECLISGIKNHVLITQNPRLIHPQIRISTVLSEPVEVHLKIRLQLVYLENAGIESLLPTVT